MFQNSQFPIRSLQPKHEVKSPIVEAPELAIALI